MILKLFPDTPGSGLWVKIYFLFLVKLMFPSGGPTGSRPRIHWRDYISRLSWECLRIPQEELENIAVEWDNKRYKMDGWMDTFSKFTLNFNPT